jgi:hypothetical protein
MNEPSPKPNSPQPKLDYETPPPGRGNTPRQVMLRMVLGVLFSLLALASGFMLMAFLSLFVPVVRTGTALVVMLLPLSVTFCVALALSIRQRRYGYATGVILGPFILVMTAGILLLMICGGRPF